MRLRQAASRAADFRQAVGVLLGRPPDLASTEEALLLRLRDRLTGTTLRH